MKVGHQRRRHGDPFPLDSGALRDLAAESGCFEPQRAQWIGDSLNKLALHTSNSFNFPHFATERPPTAVQDFVMGRVVESLKLHGDKPLNMTPETALHELQAAEFSYDGMPNNLASYDPGKLKVLRSQVQPKRISKFLPVEPAKLVEHYESQMLLPNHADDSGFSPYWDPALKYDRSRRLDFILRLHKSGLVKLRRSPKSFIGAFFVKKKTPDAIRMVLDCRGTNKLHQPPPTTRLGSARCYADLDLAEVEEGNGWGIEADVNDAFYNFSIPELTHYFAFNHPLEAHMWSDLGVDAASVYDPATRQYVQTDAHELLFPCVEAVPMGWSWALFLCNEAVLNICRQHSPWMDGVFRERKETPQLDQFRTSLGVYVDNITIVGREKSDVCLRASWVREAFERAGIPLTWSQDSPVQSLESVGCNLDFVHKRVSNKPRRVWKFFLATLALLRRKKLKGKVLQIWAGHFTSLCSLYPCALACLEHIYRFIEVSREKRIQVWSSVRCELKLACALVWLAWRDLGAPLCQTVEVGDSSSSGYALMSCRPGQDRLRRAMASQEKWRFIPMPENLRSAAARKDAEEFEQILFGMFTAADSGGGPGSVRPAGLSTGYGHMVMDAMREGSWLGTSAIRSQFRAAPSKRIDVDIPSLVEPLDNFFADTNNFRLLWARRWKNVDEHINIKECRVALSSLRRSCRVRDLMSHRKLTVSDNMATVSALSKGRSSSFKMNKLCKVAAAFQLGVACSGI